MATLGAPAPATAAEPIGIGRAATSTVAVYGDKSAQFVPLGVGKSIVIDLPGDIKDVLVAEPKIANAVVRTSRRAYIIGVSGRPDQRLFLRRRRKQLMALDIAVTRDLNGIRAALKQLLPGAEIAVEGIADGIMLSGSVARSERIAAGLRSGRPPRRQRRQGHKRHHRPRPRPGDAARDGRRGAARHHQAARHRPERRLVNRQNVLNFNNANPFPVVGQALVIPIRSRAPGRGQRDRTRDGTGGVIRTLAEPNLTAISGETANFLAGGEFPIPAGFTCDPTTRNCQTQIQFQIRVGLNFTPVVMSEGRNQPQGVDRGVRVVERKRAHPRAIDQLESDHHADRPVDQDPPGRDHGRTSGRRHTAMAGMIHEQTKQQLNGIPGLMNLPVLARCSRAVTSSTGRAS